MVDVENTIRCLFYEIKRICVYRLDRCLTLVRTPAEMNWWRAYHEKLSLRVPHVFPKVSKIALEMKAVPAPQEVRLIFDGEPHLSFDAELKLLPMMVKLPLFHLGALRDSQQHCAECFIG